MNPTDCVRRHKDSSQFLIGLRAVVFLRPGRAEGWWPCRSIKHVHSHYGGYRMSSRWEERNHCAADPIFEGGGQNICISGTTFGENAVRPHAALAVRSSTA